MDTDIKINYKKIIEMLDELCLMYMNSDNLKKNKSYKFLNNLYTFLSINYSQNLDKFEIVSVFRNIDINKLNKILPLKCLEINEREIFIEKKVNIIKIIT